MLGVVSSIFLVGVLAAQVDPGLLSGLRWRLVGPFRGGRSLSAVGVPSSDRTFYFGSVGGGVWETTDAGLSWRPIFDSQPIASIGAVAVAPSNPNIIYVGSGEADMRSDIGYGNGMYKSSDAGKTWTHIGLEDTHQIGRVIVDPHNPDVVFVAALGHAYAPNSERGVFRSNDGGKTWSRVLYKDDNTGAIDIAFDPQNSQTIYASMWQTRRPPWNIYPPSNGPGSGLYKSIDGGATWTQLQGGLPSEGLGRIGIAVAPSNPNRVYLIVDAKQGGLYRSDDAGKTWTRTDDEARIWTRGWYFGTVTVDPNNADVVYIPNTSVYKSIDGGKSFVGFKGEPGGDDYHSVWVAPEDSNRIIISSDQGTVITLNGGKTWSSWYNQPTAQFYHAITDNRFPYWIYGPQQDSGAIAVASRSNYASITERDVRPISVGEENGYVAPDPLNTDVVFGGTVTRYNWLTAQNQDVSPSIGRPENFRHTWTLPLVFSPADPHKLYFSHQMLFRTMNGGNSWDQISPDLTRENPGVPPNLDATTGASGLASPRKGVIYAIAPSPLDAQLVWIGTDDGLIQITSDDGKHWTNITPPQLTPWSKVGIIEASHFDKLTAYAAVDRHRLDDRQPYIYRTHDGGKTWQMVANGIPAGHFVNVVREDPKKRGLLYAGTELGIYISFDDGDHWQPLQLNLPITSVRDIEVHGNDLVVATHGRSLWIMDDIEPLREINPAVNTQPAHLFQPTEALRIRPGSDQATPYPKELPHGENPPNGAIVYYYLKDVQTAPVTLEVLDSKGTVIRRYASNQKPRAVQEKSLRVTMDWVTIEPSLSAAAGMHRFVWNLQYPPAALNESQPWRSAVGVWALPGKYTVRLTAGGHTYEQPLAVKMDPRVNTPTADLAAQFDIAQRTAAAIRQISPALKQAKNISSQVAALQLKTKDNSATGKLLSNFMRQLSTVMGPPPLNYGAPVIPLITDRTSLEYLLASYTELEDAVESADRAPTQEQESASQTYDKTLQTTIPEWHGVLQDLAKLNQQLKEEGLTQITAQPASNVPESEEY